MPTEQEQQEQQSVTGDTPRETAGKLLKRTRIERGLDEKQVADQLRITVHYVKAIEGDHYEKLPGAIFARGYLKGYAKLLKLDTADIVARYEAATNGSQARRDRDSTQEHAANSSVPNGARWALISVAAFALLFVGIWIFSGPSEESAGADSAVATRAAVEPDSTPRASPSNSVARPVASEPTLPVSQPPQDRTNSAPAIAGGLEPAIVEAPESPGRADKEPTVRVADDSGAESEADSQTVAPAQAREEPAAEAITRSEPDSAVEPAQAASEAESDAAPEPDAVAVAATPVDAAGNSEPDGAEATDSGRPEELVEINVLQGDNGERIIEVRSEGNDVLQISFTGESWVEVNDADQRLIYRDLRESGDILEVTGRAPFNILLGDAPLTSLRLNGATVDVSDDIRIDNSARLTVGL